MRKEVLHLNETTLLCMLSVQLLSIVNHTHFLFSPECSDKGYIGLQEQIPGDWHNSGGRLILVGKLIHKISLAFEKYTRTRLPRLSVACSISCHPQRTFKCEINVF